MPHSRKPSKSESPDDSPAGINSRARYMPFPTTDWVLLSHARAGHDQSLDQFYRRYATPAFCFLKSAGLAHEKAKDLTQEVLLKLASGRLLGNVRQQKGRFRSYLMAALKNAVKSARRHDMAVERMPPDGVASLDQVLEEAGSAVMQGQDLNPREAFEKQYAREALNAATRRVQADCRRDGLEEHFEMFALRYLEDPGLAWTEIAERFGTEADTVRNRATTVVARYRKALLEELRLDGVPESELAPEIEHLIVLFRKPESRSASSPQRGHTGRSP